MSNKEVALQIIHFLKNSTKEINQDFIESIDVAIDCIADAFEVNKDEDVLDQFQGLSLKEILNNAKSSSTGISTSVPVTVDFVEVDAETKAKAEALKAEGNKAITSKEFQTAVDKYTAAIELDSCNPVYFSNRAAAYSSLRDFENAIKDAESALKINPNYSKAYSRLGLANYALGRSKEAMEAYKKGLESEGDSPSESMKKGYETAKKRVEEQLDASNGAVEESSTPRAGASSEAGAGSGLPDLSSLAGMFGNSGGNGGAPNFADMLNNPSIMQAAERMMSDPNALNNLMSNPAIQQMASQFGLGGGAGAGSGAGSGAGGSPDFASLLNNPALRGMAENFMNGRGGAGRQ